MITEMEFEEEVAYLVEMRGMSRTAAVELVNFLYGMED